MTEGGGGEAGMAPATTEAPNLAAGSLECYSPATNGAVALFNGLCDGAEIPAIGGSGKADAGPAESFNAAALGEGTDSPLESGDRESAGPAGEAPNWYRHWQATGRLPPDPRPNEPGLPLWDPGPAYRQAHGYLDELAKGVPGGGGAGGNQMKEGHFKEFEEWKKEMDKTRARFEQTLEWNRRAIQRARARSPI